MWVWVGNNTPDLGNNAFVDRVTNTNLGHGDATNGFTLIPKSQITSGWPDNDNFNFLEKEYTCTNNVITEADIVFED